MSSQDTMKYAESEEEKAKELQHEIEGQQMQISKMQADISRIEQVTNSLEQRRADHFRDAQNLRQKAMAEQRQEQQAEQEKIRHQQEHESLMRKAAEKSIDEGMS